MVPYDGCNGLAFLQNELVIQFGLCILIDVARESSKRFYKSKHCWAGGDLCGSPLPARDEKGGVVVARLPSLPPPTSATEQEEEASAVAVEEEEAIVVLASKDPEVESHEMVVAVATDAAATVALVVAWHEVCKINRCASCPPRCRVSSNASPSHLQNCLYLEKGLTRPFSKSPCKSSFQVYWNTITARPK